MHFAEDAGGRCVKEYEVTSAYSMTDGVKRATAEGFDLYVLDYHLPDGVII
jgi:CheY-like chemotaxis protein